MRASAGRDSTNDVPPAPYSVQARTGKCAMQSRKRTCSSKKMFQVYVGPTPSSHLLIVDCETHRFAVTGPLKDLRSGGWIKQVERAARFGRGIFCIPVSGMEREEVVALGGMFGYQEWPANTMIEPFFENPEADITAKHSVAVESNSQLQARELAAMSRSGRK